VKTPACCLLGLLVLGSSSTAGAAADPSPAAPAPSPATPPPLPPPSTSTPPPLPPPAEPAPVITAQTPSSPEPARAEAAVTAASPAPHAPSMLEPDAATPRASDTRVAMWRLELGYRGSYVPSAGFDPFSTNDFLPQVSLTASRTLFAASAFSLALGLAWDHGSSDATARGDETSLDFNRFTVPIEARVHFGRWGYAFARVAPGVAVANATLGDPSEPAALTKTQWLFATDLSGGYAWLVWPPTREPSSTARLWLQADGGYGWVASERLDLGPALASTDARLANGADLGSLSMSGAFFRLGAAISY
jgi:hypothetical protein